MNGADKQYHSEKRPVYMTRDPYTWKETYIHEKRPIKETTPQNTWTVQTNSILPKKETYIHGDRLIYMKRDLLKRQHLGTHGRCRQTVSF